MSYIPERLLKIKERPGDYWRDGLLYCGKCNTPRSSCVNLDGSEQVVPSACLCDREAEAAEAEKERAKRAEQLRERCLPLEKMRSARFDGAEDCKAVQIARRYVDKWDVLREKNIGLLFCGNTGSGKSYAALCIANSLIDREVPARYITFPEAVTTMREGGEARAALEKAVKNTPLLILDDLGAEGGSDYSQSLVCQLVDMRDRTGKPLIVTTNLPIAQFQGHADEQRARAADRIAKLCVPVSVTGASRRQQQAEEKLKQARSILGL